MKRSKKLIIFLFLLIFLAAVFLPVVLLTQFSNMPKERVLTPCSYTFRAESYGGVAENVTLIVPTVKYGEKEMNYTIPEKDESEEVEYMSNQTYLRIHFEKLLSRTDTTLDYDGVKRVEMIPSLSGELSNLEKLKVSNANVSNANKTEIYAYFENASKIIVDASFDINEDYYITVFGKKIRVTQAVTHGTFDYCEYHAVITEDENGKWIKVPVEYRDVWWLYD